MNADDLIRLVRHLIDEEILDVLVRRVLAIIREEEQTNPLSEFVHESYAHAPDYFIGTLSGTYSYWPFAPDGETDEGGVEAEGIDVEDIKDVDIGTKAGSFKLVYEYMEMRREYRIPEQIWELAFAFRDDEEKRERGHERAIKGVYHEYWPFVGVDLLSGDIFVRFIEPLYRLDGSEHSLEELDDFVSDHGAYQQFLEENDAPRYPANFILVDRRNGHIHFRHMGNEYVLDKDTWHIEPLDEEDA